MVLLLSESTISYDFIIFDHWNLFWRCSSSAKGAAWVEPPRFGDVFVIALQHRFMKVWVRSKSVDCLCHTSDGTIEKFTTGGEIQYPVMWNPKLLWEHTCTKSFMDFSSRIFLWGVTGSIHRSVLYLVDNTLMMVCECLRITWGFSTSACLQCQSIQCWQGLGIGWPLLLGSWFFSDIFASFGIMYGCDGQPFDQNRVARMFERLSEAII